MLEKSGLKLLGHVKKATRQTLHNVYKSEVAVFTLLYYDGGRKEVITNE